MGARGAGHSHRRGSGLQRANSHPFPGGRWDALQSSQSAEAPASYRRIHVSTNPLPAQIEEKELVLTEDRTASAILK